MKQGPAYLYQLSFYKFPVAIYYVVILLLTTVVSVQFFSVGTETARMNGGYDGATAIFLFVTSLFVFREAFLMLAQNGVTRKCMFRSRLAVTASIAFLLAIIEQVVLALETLIWSFRGAKIYSIYDMLFHTSPNFHNTFSRHAGILIFDFLLYLAVIALSYAIAVLFYRLSKAGKIAVGVGVPIFFFFICPMMDQYLFGGGMTVALNAFFRTVLGTGGGGAPVAMLTFFVCFIVFSALSWLLIRKAPVKAN